MRPRIKICGLTRLEDARFCAAAGADYLGFVLAEDSPRRVDPDLAREIVGWVYGPLTVGVFRDARLDHVNRVARHVGFDLVQLHGSESPDYCRAVEAPVIKAVAVTPDARAHDLEREVERYRDRVRYVLLDTSVRGSSGGTGQTFDWPVASRVVEGNDTFVAGGIGPHNILTVAEQLNPFGLDVSSGAEDSPGVKSFEKVSALLDTLRETST